MSSLQFLKSFASVQRSPCFKHSPHNLQKAMVPFLLEDAALNLTAYVFLRTHILCIKIESEILSLYNKIPLCEKCPNAEFFLVPYFPVFGLNTGISVFSPNTGKYGSEKTSYLTTFHAVYRSQKTRIHGFIMQWGPLQHVIYQH